MQEQWLSGNTNTGGEKQKEFLLQRLGKIIFAGHFVASNICINVSILLPA